MHNVHHLRRKKEIEASNHSDYSWDKQFIQLRNIGHSFLTCSVIDCKSMFKVAHPGVCHFSLRMGKIQSIQILFKFSVCDLLESPVLSTAKKRGVMAFVFIIPAALYKQNVYHFQLSCQLMAKILLKSGQCGRASAEHHFIFFKKLQSFFG